MSILKRGMIFITFFGCCFAIALVAAAMGTKFWLESDAIQRRINPDKTLEVRPNSTGHVNFGLFKGRKSLNVGFGTRVHHFDGEYKATGDYNAHGSTILLFPLSSPSSGGGRHFSACRYVEFLGRSALAHQVYWPVTGMLRYHQSLDAPRALGRRCRCLRYRARETVADWRELFTAISLCWLLIISLPLSPPSSPVVVWIVTIVSDL